MTTVTVVVAAYRAAAFLPTALDSALAQNGIDVQIVVVDDASPDATAQAAELHLARAGHQNGTVLRLPVNGGPSAARNCALSAAKGDWIAVLDADDRMHPQRLATLVAIAEVEKSDLIMDNLWVCDAFGTRLRRHLQEPDDGGVFGLQLDQYATSNRMFSGRPALGYLKPIIRRSFLDHHALRYDEALRVGEDFMIVADALALGGRVTRVRQTLYDYTTRAGSISHRLSSEEAARMRDADTRFVARHRGALSASERRALQRHRAALSDAHAFLSSMEALKSGQPLQALLRAMNRPSSLRHLHMPVRARIARLLGDGQAAMP